MGDIKKVFCEGVGDNDGFFEIEVESDQETLNDMGAIAGMVKHATEEGLLIEVIWSFGQAQRANQPIPESASYALSEWDI